MLFLSSFVTFHLDPWNFCFFSREVPGENHRTEGRRRWDFRRGESPAVRGKWGKMERGSRATLGWPWLVGRGSEEAGPRRGAAGGGSARRRRCSGRSWDGRSGSGASVRRGDASGSGGLGNAELRRPVRGEVTSSALMGAGGWRKLGSHVSPGLGSYL